VKPSRDANSHDTSTSAENLMAVHTAHTMNMPSSYNFWHMCCMVVVPWYARQRLDYVVFTCRSPEGGGGAGVSGPRVD
jgi:hypothetical protein